MRPESLRACVVAPAPGHRRRNKLTMMVSTRSCNLKLFCLANSAWPDQAVWAGAQILTDFQGAGQHSWCTALSQQLVSLQLWQRQQSSQDNIIVTYKHEMATKKGQLYGPSALLQFSKYLWSYSNGRRNSVINIKNHYWGKIDSRQNISCASGIRLYLKHEIEELIKHICFTDLHSSGHSLKI